jgi:hypothetical protein
MTKPIKNLYLSFNDGKFLNGSWNLPDPNDPDPASIREFNRISCDIGWHICYSIAGGARKCEFKTGPMPERFISNLK